MNAFGALVLLASVAAAALGLYMIERATDRRKVITERRARLVERLRNGGIVAVRLSLEEQCRQRTQPYRQRGRRHEARQAWARRRAAEASAQVWRDGSWSSGFVVVTVLLTAAWIFVFALQRNLDVAILLVLGHDPATAVVLGTAVAVAIAVCGLLVTGLLNVHALLPAGLRMRHWLRQSAALAVLALFALLAFALPAVATYRSQDVLGPEVSKLAKIVAEARTASHSDPLRLQVAERALADAQKRLDAGRSLDETVTYVVPTVELLTSFAPVYLAELGIVGGFSTIAAWSGWRGRRAGDRVERIEQAYRSEATEIAYDAELDQEQSRLFGVGWPGPDTDPPPQLPPAGGTVPPSADRPSGDEQADLERPDPPSDGPADPRSAA